METIEGIYQSYHNIRCYFCAYSDANVIYRDTQAEKDVISWFYFTQTRKKKHYKQNPYQIHSTNHNLLKHCNNVQQFCYNTAKQKLCDERFIEKKTLQQ